MNLWKDTITRPPLRYYGSKFRIAPWIIGHFPPHEHYVEVFGGGAGVLLRKPRSTTEVYNDLDNQVVNIFQILRNPLTCEKLAHAIALTPFSRHEFNRSYEPTDDTLEAARRFVVRCNFGHGTCSINPKDSNGFRTCDTRAGKSYAREWAGIPDALRAAGMRFVGITIENQDFRKLIPRFDGPNTFFFCDPPYPMSTRSAGGKGYVHEMDDEAHRQLAWLLKRVKGKVILTTYQNRLYDTLYEGWACDVKKTTANGQSGAVPRTEMLIKNF